MDKTMKDIPINIRVIGTPGGDVILYLEDYVYTFLKKITEKDDENVILRLYGHVIADAGRERYLVNGACDEDETNDFTGCDYLGTARLSKSLTCDVEITFVSAQGARTKHDSYYIYYDQNEQMQNYLIKWNIQKNRNDNRREADNAVRYGKLAMNYNKEETRVSYIWNMMNVLSLSFIICIMVYAVTSINSYQKMKEMEEQMNYIVSAVSEYVTISKENPILSQNEVRENAITQETSSEVVYPTYSETAEESSEETVVSETVASPIKYYVVRKGDTLYSICCEIYGDGGKVPEICQINNLDNPNNILSGQKLLLP